MFFLNNFSKKLLLLHSKENRKPDHSQSHNFIYPLLPLWQNFRKRQRIREKGSWRDTVRICVVMVNPLDQWKKHETLSTIFYHLHPQRSVGWWLWCRLVWSLARSRALHNHKALGLNIQMATRGYWVHPECPLHSHWLEGKREVHSALAGAAVG